MVHTRLYLPQIVVQIVLGTLVPIALLALTQLVNLTERARRGIYATAGVLTLIGIFAMRWNVVIGGQLFSKSFLGYTTYKMGFATREGLLPAVVLMILPFVILWVLVRLLPPWPDEGKAEPAARLEHRGAMVETLDERDVGGRNAPGARAAPGAAGGRAGGTPAPGAVPRPPARGRDRGAAAAGAPAGRPGSRRPQPARARRRLPVPGPDRRRGAAAARRRRRSGSPTPLSGSFRRIATRAADAARAPCSTA